MKKRLITVIVTLILVIVVVIPVAAITDGEPDGEAHPYVGLMVADDADGNPQWRCSGTLISPTLFITAGHCTESPAVRATVWFDSNLHNPDYTLNEYYGYPEGGPTSIDGDVFVHPDFNSSAFFLYDVGMVVLDTPVFMDEYGTLPSAGELDSLKKGNKGANFTSVGYGLQAAYPDAAGWKDVAYKTRMVSHPFLIQINVPGFTSYFSMLLSNNHATGGTCFGDSGGPNFLGNTNKIAGITSFGINPTCAGTGGVYRLDQSVALDWVQQFLDGTLP